MIRYQLPPAQWVARIEGLAPGWQGRADERTAECVTAGEYVSGKKSLWTEIKRLYMETQGFKCGFCERRLENSPFGNVEHDVEHFRPKAGVVPWPTADIATDRGLQYSFVLRGDSDVGYFRLAYHRENYLISCKTCNSALKKSFFPHAGPPDLTGTSPRQMRDEEPFLLYPIGTVDQHDPQDVITFDGIQAIPVTSQGKRHRRARVTIDFFALNDRAVLLDERAETILSLYLALRAMGSGNATERAIGTQLAARLTSDDAAHANCARSFRQRFESDPATAQDIADAAMDHLAAL